MKPVDWGMVHLLREGLMVVGTDTTDWMTEKRPVFVGMTPLLDNRDYPEYDRYYTIDPADTSEVDWHTASIQAHELFQVFQKNRLTFVYGHEIDDARFKKDGIRIFHVEREGK